MVYMSRTVMRRGCWADALRVFPYGLHISTSCFVFFLSRIILTLDNPDRTTQTVLDSGLIWSSVGNQRCSSWGRTVKPGLQRCCHGDGQRRHGDFNAVVMEMVWLLWPPQGGDVCWLDRCGVHWYQDQRPSLSHTESYQTQPLTVRVEKVVLSNDLRDVHAFFQHLVITQVVGRKAASPEAHLLDLLSPGDRLGHLPV